jgi:hypothetical protein
MTMDNGENELFDPVLARLVLRITIPGYRFDPAMIEGLNEQQLANFPNELTTMGVLLIEAASKIREIRDNDDPEEDDPEQNDPTGDDPVSSRELVAA